MKKIKRFLLPFVVFVTGSCVLIIEIVGMRLLSPYFGNTVYTVTSVISVILAALSIGYYFGGRFADWKPHLSIFFGIISGSGIALFIIYYISIYILPTAGYTLSVVEGPLIFAAILFFLPCFLLGMLSPFAIKLQKTLFPHEGIGKVSGEIFFWSTLGSIAGTLLSGFYLIPMFGLLTIVTAIGTVLMGVGAIGMMFSGAFTGRNMMLLCILSILVNVFHFQNARPQQKGVLYAADGIYEQLKVYDGEFYGKPARFFQQDRTMSSAMDIQTGALVFSYTRYYDIYKIFNPDIKRVLVIGGGAYTMPAAYLNALPEAQVDVAEIEPRLLDLGKRYFRVPEDVRLHNYITDGRRFLHDSKTPYDLIFSDVYYSYYSIPAHFTTKEFFQIAKNALAPEGILMLNIIGSLSNEPPSFALSEIRTFQSVFANMYVFATDSPVSKNSQNLIFVGYNSEKVLDIRNLDPKTTAHLSIQNIQNQSVDLKKFELQNYVTLTDDYAPVEYLARDILRKRE